MASDDKDERRAIFRKEVGFEPTPVKHESVSVLMLHWHADDDDLEVAGEVERLRKVFSELYRYNVTVKQLTTNRSASRSAKHSPQFQAEKHLQDFIWDHDSDRSLLIVYYAGHGGSEADDNFNIILTGRKVDTPNAGKKDRVNYAINWRPVEKMFFKANADILVVFDCCHAGLLCRPIERGGPHSFHYLGACEANGTTMTAGKQSFTTAFTDVLEELVAQPMSSVNMEELKCRIKERSSLPLDQYPQYYPHRLLRSPGELYISPMPEEGSDLNTQVGKFRDEQEEQLKSQDVWDVRFCFNERVDQNIIQHFARKLNEVRYTNRQLEGSISLLPTAEVIEWTDAAKAAAYYWRSVAYKRKASNPKPPKVSNTTDKSSLAKSAPRRTSKGKIKVLSPGRQRISSPPLGKSDERLKLSIPALDTSVTDLSEADTCHPSTSYDERSLLLSGQHSENDSSDEDKSADTHSVFYHLRAATTLSLINTASAVKWSIAHLFICWPRARHDGIGQV